MRGVEELTEEHLFLFCDELIMTGTSVCIFWCFCRIKCNFLDKPHIFPYSERMFTFQKMAYTVKYVKLCNVTFSLQNLTPIRKGYPPIDCIMSTFQKMQKTLAKAFRIWYHNNVKKNSFDVCCVKSTSEAVKKGSCRKKSTWTTVHVARYEELTSRTSKKWKT